MPQRTLNLSIADYVLVGKYRRGEDVVVNIDASLEGFTITMPDATLTIDTHFYFNKTGSKTVTLAPINNQKIRGDATLEIKFNNSSPHVISNRANWLVV